MVNSEETTGITEQVVLDDFVQEDDAAKTESNLRALLAELSDSDRGEVRIYEQNGTGKMPLSYLFCYSPGDYTYGQLLEKLRLEEGGGLYRIHVRDGERLLANRPISIGGPKRIKDRQSLSVVPDVVSQPSSLGMAAFERALERQNAVLESMAAKMSGGGSGKKDTAEIVQLMVMMKELFGTPAPSTHDPLQLMRTMLEMQSSLTPPENATSSDILLALINKAMPMLAQLGAQPAPAQGMGSKLLASVSAAAGDQQPAAISTTEAVTGKQHPMRAQLIQLVSMASKGFDPAPYAQMIVDNTPDEHLKALYEFAAAENAVARMAEIYSPVAKYPEWFAKLREEIIEELTAVDEDEENLVAGEVGEEGHILTKKTPVAIPAEKTVAAGPKKSNASRGGKQSN